jgi:signal transduction histidine kinase/FixJ family two-component response regulator
MIDTRILIVDDEPGITQLCEKLLVRSGYLVSSFTNPVLALEHAKQAAVDLLLVDIRMPTMSGFELIQNMKQFQPDMAVLVMTGFGTVETAIQALRQGVDGLLLKPFESGKELIQAIKLALTDSQKKHDAARIQALRPLFDVTEPLLAETHPDRLLELVINAIGGYLHSNNAAFYLYNPESKYLSSVTTRGIYLPNEKSRKKGGLIGQTDAMSTPIWVNIDGPGELDLKKAISALGLSSAITAPLVRQNLRGVLFAGRATGESAFREVDVEMFLLLARQAGIAMENAKLYEELRNYVRQVEESQQALIRAEKMAAAGRLTASIAHEINNPLQAVQNCLHLGVRSDLNQEKRDEYIQLAYNELERLMGTVQRMLDFYRPGSLDMQRVDIAELLQHVIKLLSPQLEERRINLLIKAPAKLPKVMAVTSQLEQVFINIILNAYDAMPDGGELRISIQSTREGVEVLFHDSGAGIPDSDRTRIFEPFFSTKKSGTGIGLSVSYGIIAAHGGNLDLVNDRGGGACFRIALPGRGGK